MNTKSTFEDKLTLGKLILIMIILMGLINSMMGCVTPKIRNIHTPTKREINKAMKYSTSDYKMNNNNYYRKYYSGQK
jgi:hypothetical protein